MAGAGFDNARVVDLGWRSRLALFVRAELTRQGDQYARAIRRAIDGLDRRLDQRVERAQLLAADAVLRASLPDQDAREQALRLVSPP